jgi:hypothetical protein
MKLLMGDLAEGILRGKTGAWYWKHGISAIVISAFEEARRHPLVILRGVTAGWLIFWPLGYLFFHFGFYELALVSLALDNPDLLIGSWEPTNWWHTAQFGRMYTFAANAIASGVMFGIGIVSGWILSVLFRPHSRIAVLFFSCTVLLSWIVYSASLADDAIGARLPWSVYFWMNSVVQTLCILIGGSMAEAKPVKTS